LIFSTPPAPFRSPLPLLLFLPFLVLVSVSGVVILVAVLVSLVSMSGVVSVVMVAAAVGPGVQGEGWRGCQVFFDLEPCVIA